MKTPKEEWKFPHRGLQESDMNLEEKEHSRKKKYDRNFYRGENLLPEDWEILPDYDEDFPCDGCVEFCRACKPNKHLKK